LRDALDSLDPRSQVLFTTGAGVAWTLPLYELALLTVARYPEASVAVATPEPRPAAVFGAVAGREVSRQLAEAGVDVHTGVLPESVEDGALWLAEGGSLDADLVVALPQPTGHGILGLPADAHGFLPVDRYGHVEGAARIWAAGDATARPLKQGGLAAQQADVAARSIAAELGGHVAPMPYEPALRSVLLTGDAPQFLRRSGLSSVPSAASARPLWSAPGKIADGRVARYLAAHEAFRVVATG
ncbi:MAG: sulfide:quinone oxidoreductase, partial [Solirubrobacteraceae bacterium]|nr:sulfide:quinone oxidoreductase [Solirubrobacteraceae bacterium]